jgi:hypothetical protein
MYLYIFYYNDSVFKDLSQINYKRPLQNIFGFGLRNKKFLERTS